MDKLDRKIGEEFWLDQNRKWLTEKENLSLKLIGYQRADTSYLEHAAFILELAKKAPRLFKQANLEQKRKLTGMLFSNSSLRGENLDLVLKTPFDKMLEASKTGNWRYLVEIVLNHELEFSTGVQVIKTVCTSLKIEVDK